jgi:hypothetical protein
MAMKQSRETIQAMCFVLFYGVAIQQSVSLQGLLSLKGLIEFFYEAKKLNTLEITAEVQELVILLCSHSHFENVDLGGDILEIRMTAQFSRAENIDMPDILGS